MLIYNVLQILSHFFFVVHKCVYSLCPGRVRNWQGGHVGVFCRGGSHQEVQFALRAPPQVVYERGEIVKILFTGFNHFFFPSSPGTAPSLIDPER